ncbi:glycosyltransferase family A protein [Candidatus Symbiothrix dinenymphae]|uniref:glycosyltransferase family A protein n=1 Tax=Candidatus Symbiothrix dinenymphae TaxID=467085 RepID=UPI0006C61ABD|nr:glycosyltransferase family A protein [Candidatus Symbiothrix dinenymphae]GAP72747.1 hypothetical protein SAMD00024442_41_7 [Candidatus Symbiothrix dinenymphae]
MKKIHIITPVKDSLETTIQTIESIMASDIACPFEYTVYNDFSSDENSAKLAALSQEKGFNLLNLSDLTQHPSPNYLLVLQTAQQRALSENAHLIIIESDVTVQRDTIQTLYQLAIANDQLPVGMVAAVTVDAAGEVNFPYLFAKKYKHEAVKTNKRLSFCCTLLTNAFLSKFDFRHLNPDKNWYDVTISHQSVKLGFANYLLMNTPVLHSPHSSRPWKLLKYTNPVKYYWLKYTKKLDKI